jgi:hypothetical protein
MADELLEARERAKAAWSLIQSDLVRIKEAVRTEVHQVKQLGPRAVYERNPLPFVGAAAAIGFLAGIRSGKGRASYVIPAGAGIEKPLRRKLLETGLLALASQGASMFAGSLQQRIEQRRPVEREEIPVASAA